MPKLSNVNSVSGYSAVVLPPTCWSNVLPDISESTVPLSAAKRDLLTVYPVSSLILPVRTTFKNSIFSGAAALAPKLLYCPEPK